MSTRHAWRLLSYAEYDGATNMAIDEAILEAHLQKAVPPTLRLYGFTPPAVSIGFNQKLPAGLMDRAKARGFEVVRRPTGGRAVLHLADFTYSFVGSSPCHSERSEESLVPRSYLNSSVSGAYKQICQGLQRAFENLGVDLHLGNSGSEYRKLHDCFGAISGSDLHYGGKKMIGSAQLRRHQGVLQHGSILLDQGQSVMPGLLERQQLETAANRHANLFEVLNRQITVSELQEVIRDGFERAFEVELLPGSLTQMELESASTRRSNYIVAHEPSSHP